VDTDVLVRDYLGRLEAAAAVLPVNRRAELVLAAPLYGHGSAGDGRADWGRRHAAARSAMI
jgi:hypothetical protein